MTASVAPVPCTIVTGFLGAGKTTLVRHLLANANGRRLAVIVNEFGDVGIDGEILKGCGDSSCPEENIVELANGCLCCTVADEFVPALDTILSRHPKVDHIIIETSGLALPKPLVQAFSWPSIKSRVTVDGVVVVADGAALAEMLVVAASRRGDVAHEAASLAARARGVTAIAGELPMPGVTTVPTRHAAHGLNVTGGPPLALDAFHTGQFIVQDEASQLIAELVDAQPGERVLDLCASPGGKTVGISAGVGAAGSIVATDVRPLLASVREDMGLDPDPIAAYLRSGYFEKIRAERVGGAAAGWGA